MNSDEPEVWEQQEAFADRLEVLRKRIPEEIAMEIDDVFLAPELGAVPDFLSGDPGKESSDERA